MECVTVKNFGIALKVNGVTIRQRIVRKKLVKNEFGLIDIKDVTNYSYIVEINGGDLSVFNEFLVTDIDMTNVNKKIIPATKIERKVVVSKKAVTIPKKNTVSTEKPVLEKVSKTKASVNIAPTVETKLPKLSAEEKMERDLAKRQRHTLLEIDIAKKQADLHNVQRTAEIKQMQLEKIMGNTLPLDQVESIMAINYKAIFKSFHSQLKNIASTMVQNLGGTKEDLNTIMIELEQSLNHIKDMAKENSEADIERIILEYSQVRSRGERKG